MLGAMADVVVTRWRDEDLTPLLLAYHLRTEAEKAPRCPKWTAFAEDTVFVAATKESTVGCAVGCAPQAGSLELKRLWVDPAGRGRGVATALVNTVLPHGDRPGVSDAGPGVSDVQEKDTE
jgi:putative acetyltransferase